MSLYQEIATFALQSNLTHASEAWEFGKHQAELAGRGTVSSRDKGCPKSAFISLAEHGYITGFGIREGKPLSENALHALAGYEVQLAQSNIVKTKSAWWRETARKRSTTRQGQNGVLDVLLAAMEAGRFEPSGNQK